MTFHTRTHRWAEKWDRNGTYVQVKNYRKSRGNQGHVNNWWCKVFIMHIQQAKQLRDRGAKTGARHLPVSTSSSWLSFHHILCLSICPSVHHSLPSFLHHLRLFIYDPYYAMCISAHHRGLKLKGRSLLLAVDQLRLFTYGLCLLVIRGSSWIPLLIGTIPLRYIYPTSITCLDESPWLFQNHISPIIDCILEYILNLTISPQLRNKYYYWPKWDPKTRDWKVISIIMTRIPDSVKSTGKTGKKKDNLKATDGTYMVPIPQ